MNLSKIPQIPGLNFPWKIYREVSNPMQPSPRPHAAQPVTKAFLDAETVRWPDVHLSKPFVLYRMNVLFFSKQQAQRSPLFEKGIVTSTWRGSLRRGSNQS
jgi:hypothetical protein